MKQFANELNTRAEKEKEESTEVENKEESKVELS